MRSALRTGITLTVILLLFLAFNLVWAPRFPDLRWDLSPHKTNTLSPAAVQLLSNLQVPLDFYYFHSRKSGEQKRYGRQVEETLKAFEKASKGMINLRIINPAPFSEDAYKAKLYGLEDNQGFLGLIGTRDGQAAQRIESFSPDRAPLLEYEISHLITQLHNPEPPMIGLLSGLSPEESIEPQLQELHRHFDVLELEPDADHVPARTKALMVVHPRRLPEQTLYAVDQFVLGGGKVMMFIDPQSNRQLEETRSPAVLDGLLASWGVAMKSDKILIDTTYASTAPLPETLTLPRKAMATSDVSTWKLDAVTVASSGVLTRLEKSQTDFTPLLRSSRQSALAQPDELDSELTRSGEQHVIAARIQGPAYSAFPDGVGERSPGLQKSAQIHVVIVADTDVLGDHLDSPAQRSNSLFVLNTLDNLAAPDELANIRPHGVTGATSQVLENLRESAEQAYQTQAKDLLRRLAHTEKEWQRMNPPATAMGTEAVDTGTQLQALNKERLSLPAELHALKTQAYAPVRRLERNMKLVLIVPVPALLCLVALGVYLWRRRRRPLPPCALY
ncbi:ABC transporter [Pseudomonas kairouanensis]|uniref:ABC transporter n=1 Tax=Pseudomonas kairouanensis TaxID=2293832 RepID=A0A4Z0B0S2_9PSED|nr:Gldg family protein [Pseudomonas kairouanensis]TFY92039.1 ABC transporter [Pseudomonas kairouanensis]